MLSLTAPLLCMIANAIPLPTVEVCMQLSSEQPPPIVPLPNVMTELLVPILVPVVGSPLIMDRIRA